MKKSSHHKKDRSNKQYLLSKNGIPWKEHIDPFIIAGVYTLLFLMLAPLGDFADWLPPDVKFNNPNSLQRRAYYSMIRIDAADDTGVYMPLKSTIIDGDVDYINERYWWNNLITETGRIWNVSYQFGSSILWLPFFLTGHLLVYIMNVFGAGFKPDGYSAPYLVMTAIGSAAYGCWGSIITYSIIKRFFRRAAVLLVAASAVMISNLHYYAFIRSRKEHTSEFFGVSLFFWVLFRFRTIEEKTLPDYLFLGIAAGLMCLIRLNTIVFCIAPFVFFIQDLWREINNEGGNPGTMLGKYGAGLISFIVVLSPMFVHAWLVGGGFLYIGNVY